MTSVRMINEVVATIFDKALAEPQFGELYADLCRFMVDDRKNKKWDLITVRAWQRCFGNALGCGFGLGLDLI